MYLNYLQKLDGVMLLYKLSFPIEELTLDKALVDYLYSHPAAIFKILSLSFIEKEKLSLLN